MLTDETLGKCFTTWFISKHLEFKIKVIASIHIYIQIPHLSNGIYLQVPKLIFILSADKKKDILEEG